MKPAGIYIHIPFCRSRCSYCDFATGPYSAESAARYVLDLASEISSFKEAGDLINVDTIYFGGGTPSLLSPDQVETILNTVRDRFSVLDGAEITMEMNPGTVSPGALQSFRQLGVNRASFGAQTFDDRELARLRRSHTSDETRSTFRFLRDAGFENVSFDLIAGLPGQTLDQWKRNIDEAIKLLPEHLSFYLLEVHEGTPLAAHIRNGLQPMPDEALAAQMYETMLDLATAVGYQHYEISNLSLPGFASRHNTKYWTGEPYFGFGCSAHSYDGINGRWANERDVTRYMSVIEGKASPVVTRSVLSEEERRSEAVFLGLRLMQGLSLVDYQNHFGDDLLKSHESELAEFYAAGLIEFDKDLIKLTRSGALFSNEVFAAFI